MQDTVSLTDQTDALINAAYSLHLAALNPDAQPAEISRLIFLAQHLLDQININKHQKEMRREHG